MNDPLTPLARIAAAVEAIADARVSPAPAKRPTRPGFIYFVRRSNSVRQVKIGWAMNPTQRVAELQTACPEQLVILCTIPGTILEEKAMQREYKALRVRGEWFRLVPPLSDFIAEHVRRERRVAYVLGERRRRPRRARLEQP